MNQQPNIQNRILGGQISQVVVGVGPHTMPGGFRGFAISCRTQGTIIAGMTVQYEALPAVGVAYAPSWVAIGLNQGDYLVSQYPILTITLTAATDSLIIYCDKPY